jgi:MbtH protein
MSGAAAGQPAFDQAPGCRVVINDEGQFSIWPADQPMPPGWKEEGMTGTRAECLDYIERTWADMRPRSLRMAMAKRPGR